jgi:hypothetical protein
MLIATTSCGTLRCICCPRCWRSSSAIACWPTFARARYAIGGDAFDAIVANLPYGVRKAMTLLLLPEPGGDEEEIAPLLTQLVRAIGSDLGAGMPLLKVSRRLVKFVPVRRNECLEDFLPDA